MWMPPGVLQLIGILCIHIILALVSSFGFLCVGIFFVYEKKVKLSLRPLLFASSLVGAELLRSYSISLLFLGEGGTIALHYSASILGNALAVTPLVELAYFGGVFGLTFILGMLVYSLYNYKDSGVYVWYVVVLLFVFLVTHYMIPTFEPKHTTTVGVITTNFPSVSDEDIAASFVRQHRVVHALSLSLMPSQPNIIVYPEDTRYVEYSNNQEKEVLQKKFPRTLFIDGNTNIYQGKMVNVSTFYLPHDESIRARGKSFLLPFNEFIPYVFKPIFAFFIPEEEMDTYIRNHTYTPIYSQKTITFDGLKIGTLLCSEILSHSTINNLKKENPSLVFFQSRLNVFHDNPIAWSMLYSATRITAAQLRRPVISSSNAAPSFIISPRGALIDVLPTGFATSTYIFGN
jgi:apolipoprotein N-acyltransferase